MPQNSNEHRTEKHEKHSVSRQSSLGWQGSKISSVSTDITTSTSGSAWELGSTESELIDEQFLRVEKTLALIKPEAMKFEEEIEDIIKEHGFEILSKRNIHLTPEQVAGFYKEHFGQPYFANLVIHMSDNPVTVLCLAKANAIEDWLNLIGPTNLLEAQANNPESIRAKYGTLGEDGEYFNAIHGSKDFPNSLREIHFFFPKLVEETLLRGKQVHDYLHARVNKTLLKGLEELCKEKPEEPLIWLADWLLTHNPYSPESIKSLDGMSHKTVDGTADGLDLESLQEVIDSMNNALRPCKCSCKCDCTKNEEVEHHEHD